MYPSILIRSVILGSMTPMAAPFLWTAPAYSAPAAGAPGGSVPSAIGWFEAHDGDTAYENLCEKSVENAWGADGVWSTASAHWQGAIAAGKAHVGDANPPAGAFIYWRTNGDGHVAIADGQGGFFSTNVNGAIRHGSNLDYFPDYLGWSDPQVPS
jgi:hypothetical protein